MRLGQLLHQPAERALAVGVADRAAQMMGALGMSDDTVVSLIVRELRPFRIYDGASELHRATLGRRFLKANVSNKE